MSAADQLEPLSMHLQGDNDGEEEETTDLNPPPPPTFDMFPTQVGYATAKASAELAKAFQEAESFVYNEGVSGIFAKRKAQVLDVGAASSDANPDATHAKAMLRPGYSSSAPSSQSHTADTVPPASSLTRGATPIIPAPRRTIKQPRTGLIVREVTTLQGDPVPTPGPNDVTLGRGKGATTSSGNVKFRELVRQKKEQYNQEHFK